jgi:Fungal specific transcription factor domain
MTAGSNSTLNRTTRTDRAGGDRENQTYASAKDTEGLDSEFVGDLKPESIFLKASHPSPATAASDNDGIGVWLGGESPGGTAQVYSRLYLKQPRSNTIYSSDPLVRKLLLPYLEDQCLSMVPPQSDFDALCLIYFEKINPIFPVLDKDTFQTMQPSQPTTILLKQAICLATSSNPSSAPYLRVSSGGPALSHKEFAQKVSIAMRTSLDLGIVGDKIVLIQSFALLSFSMQGRDGGDLPAQLGSRAIHYLQTVGLHLRSFRGEHEDEYAERLFCGVWALDRLNAAFHGRPVLMHERDFGRDLEKCFQKQQPCFQLFLRVVTVLDKVIDLYRPTADQTVSGWEDNFPSFDELLDQSGGHQIDTPLLGTSHSCT